METLVNKANLFWLGVAFKEIFFSREEVTNSLTENLFQKERKASSYHGEDSEESVKFKQKQAPNKHG